MNRNAQLRDAVDELVANMSDAEKKRLAQSLNVDEDFTKKLKDFVSSHVTTRQLDLRNDIASKMNALSYVLGEMIGYFSSDINEACAHVHKLIHMAAQIGQVAADAGEAINEAKEKAKG